MGKLHFYYTSLLVEVKGFEPLHTEPKTVALTITLYRYLFNDDLISIFTPFCKLPGETLSSSSMISLSFSSDKQTETLLYFLLMYA